MVNLFAAAANNNNNNNKLLNKQYTDKGSDQLVDILEHLGKQIFLI